MRLYHRTDAAHRILAEGFRDAEGPYLTDTTQRGVWLSNVPLDPNEGTTEGPLLTLDIPEDVLADYEWVEEGKPYREFLVPAGVVNRYGPPTIDEDD